MSGMGWRVAVLVIIPVSLIGCSEQARHPARRTAAAPAAMVEVHLSATSRPIPADFFGVGVEVRELPLYAHAGRVFQRAVSLMRPTMEASIPLRVGGYSADQAYWLLTPQSSASGLFRIGRGWMRKLGRVAHELRAQVTLATNLAVHSPSMAAALARAASRALAPSRLAGIVVGDEPDLYGREPWLASERVSSTTSASAHWTVHFSPAAYRRVYRAYGHAVRLAVPGVPLSGPELANRGTGWLRSLNGLGALKPSAITVHRYPARCRPVNSPDYPNIPLLLSDGASTGLANSLRPALRIAHAQRLPLVVSEMNSASCSGPAGVSNSFASALWAPDALFEMIRAGIRGVDWHLRPYRLNAPFELKPGGIVPLPELYGLTMFARMLQPGARLDSAHVISAPGTRIKTWVVRSRSGTGVLLINKGPDSTSVSVSGPGLRGAGQAEQLSAPSLEATGGVTLGGRSIGPDARWHGRLRMVSVSAVGGTYTVSVPAYSAMLMTW